MMIQNVDEWLIDQRVMLSSRRTTTGKRNELTGTSLKNKGRCKLLHLERKNPMQQYMWGATELESSSTEKDIGSWWTSNLAYPVGGCATGESPV